MAARLTTKSLTTATSDKRFKSGKRYEVWTWYKVVDENDEELFQSPNSHLATTFVAAYNLGQQRALTAAARETELLCVDV